MEEMKCSQCGSNNLVRENWYMLCENCKAKYNLDASGVMSKKLDDLFRAGCTAMDNEDYRNAASFFRSALEINPMNGRIFHYYNYVSDRNYLNWKGKKAVRVLVDSMKSKMGTIIDMYHNLPDAEERKDCLLEAVDDFDVLCSAIGLRILDGYSNGSITDTDRELFVYYYRGKIDTFDFIIEKIMVYGDTEAAEKARELKAENVEADQDLVDEILNRKNDNSNTLESIQPPTNSSQYLEKKESRYESINRPRRLLGGFGDVLANGFGGMDFDSVIKIFHPIAALVFGILTIVCYNNAKSSDGTSLAFCLVSCLMCCFGTYELFRGFDTGPIAVRTLLWILTLGFICFGKVFGLGDVLRLVIGIILLLLEYVIIDKYRNY